MAQSKILSVAFVLLALVCVAHAQKSKTFDLKLVATAGQDSNAKLGDTAVVVRELAQGGKMYNSGIYVDVKSSPKVVNYMTTVVIENGSDDFPNGQIFAVGSGTGVQDTAMTTPKTIIGGTGAYANARGVLGTKDGKLTINLF